MCVCTHVCAFVSMMITKKFVDGFRWNFQDSYIYGIRAQRINFELLIPVGERLQELLWMSLQFTYFHTVWYRGTKYDILNHLGRGKSLRTDHTLTPKRMWLQWAFFLMPNGHGYIIYCRATKHVISTDTKIWLYKAIVMSVGIYASETWKITTKIAQKFNVFHQRCMHKILHVTYRDQVTNEEVLLRTGSRKLEDTVAERRFCMAGYILRLPSHRPSKVAMSWAPDNCRWRRGRSKKTWSRTFQEVLTRANITWKEAEYTAMDCPLWHQAAAQCAYWHGRN